MTTRNPGAMIVMIPYPADIGFAIGRLVRVFYELALQITGQPSKVHFSFSETKGLNCENLPTGFSNTVQFGFSAAADPKQNLLMEYIRNHDIKTAFALDMPVEFPCLRAMRRAGIDTIISYWGAPISSTMPWPILALKRLEVSLVRRHKPDYFIFESEAMRTLAVLGRGLRQSATTVIPTGLDATLFQRRDEWVDIVRTRYDIPSERRIIVFMGHLHERKGVRTLLEAAVHLVTELNRNDVHLLLLGNSETEAEEYASLARPAEPFITFGGYQNDVPKLLSGCTLGCVPSTGWDSFPMSSLEMQACGLPVIVSDLQGTPETIEVGVTGQVVQAGNSIALANKISEMIDDPERLKLMSIAARHRIERQFTKEIQVQNLADFVAKVIC